jgi:hypothetical protein
VLVGAVVVGAVVGVVVGVCALMVAVNKDKTIPPTIPSVVFISLFFNVERYVRPSLSKYCAKQNLCGKLRALKLQMHRIHTICEVVTSCTSYERRTIGKG